MILEFVNAASLEEEEEEEVSTDLSASKCLPLQQAL
jgi:hypothetical protein